MLTFMLLCLLVSAAWPAPVTITVGSDPLWTDTGIVARPNDAVAIDHISGGWTWADWNEDAPLSGPRGSAQPGLTWDEWIRNGQHGQLIGYIGTDDPNAFPRTVKQDSSGLFVVGDGVEFLNRLTGKVWLGFNDDYSNDAWVDDNSGSVVVSLDITPVPEPSTLLLFGAGLAGIGLALRRFRK